MLYFSAHWCGPCRQFTPALSKFYTDLKQKRSDFEIVFVSSDRDDASFDDYFGTMPWVALPFSEREKKAQLSSQYGVRGIPTLVVLNTDGSVITKDGREALMTDREGDDFPWIPKPVTELMGESFDGHNGAKVSRSDLAGKVQPKHSFMHPCITQSNGALGILIYIICSSLDSTSLPSGALLAKASLRS